MSCVCESCSVAAVLPAVLLIMLSAVVLVNCSCCGTDMRGPVASRSSKVMGAEAVTPRQRETGALSVTAQGRGWGW